MMVKRTLNIEPDVLAELQKEADERYEGNVSFLIRQILKDHLKQQKEDK